MFKKQRPSTRKTYAVLLQRTRETYAEMFRNHVVGSPPPLREEEGGGEEEEEEGKEVEANLARTGSRRKTTAWCAPHLFACRGGSRCPHGKLKQHCTVCTGCPHGKRKSRYAECNPGKRKCPHGKAKNDCKECGKSAKGKPKEPSDSSESELARGAKRRRT